MGITSGVLALRHLYLVIQTFSRVKKPARPSTLPLQTDPPRTQCAGGMNERLVTNRSGARAGLVLARFRIKYRDGSLRAGGLSPLSFAYFLCGRRPEGSPLGGQRKVGAAPHRGNANRPLRTQGKANTARQTKITPRRRRQKNHYPLAAGALYATQSTSTLQSITMLDTTHARAGGFSPKYSRNTLLNEAKSRGSSNQTPHRTTCSAP
jgi:hypothetical protein